MIRGVFSRWTRSTVWWTESTGSNSHGLWQTINQSCMTQNGCSGLDREGVFSMSLSGPHISKWMAVTYSIEAVGRRTCHTRFLCQNQVLIVCMTQDKLFHRYGPKVFTDNQMSRIKYNYYISNVSKDYDDSQWNRIVKDSTSPQEWQPGQHVT
jgi:hypothetical protein